jgi:hypothetical protein
VPLSAVYGAPDTLIVTFDQALVGGALSTVPWAVRIGGYTYNVASATASGVEVGMLISQGAANPGADVVSWTPPPADIVSAGTGVPAAAFADFPIT